MSNNVVRFEARRPESPPSEPPPLTFVEVRLRDANCDLQMSMCDSEGNTFVLEYALKSSAGFDLNRLRRAWAEWRGDSCAAS